MALGSHRGVSSGDDIPCDIPCDAIKHHSMPISKQPSIDMSTPARYSSPLHFFTRVTLFHPPCVSHVTLAVYILRISPQEDTLFRFVRDHF